MLENYSIENYYIFFYYEKYSGTIQQLSTIWQERSISSTRNAKTIFCLKDEFLILQNGPSLSGKCRFISKFFVLKKVISDVYF